MASPIPLDVVTVDDGTAGTAVVTGVGTSATVEVDVTAGG